jgi:hypothetical protein
MLDINALRQNFAAESDKKNANKGPSGPSRYFPFWNMPIGQSSSIRFLPDVNTDNPYGFLVEKRMHELTINGNKYKVPCNHMYGEECPICKASQAYYKAGDEVNGKKFWRKQSYIGQALVTDSSVPLKEDDEDPVGKVKLVSITYTLYKIIKDAFESGDLDEVPFDFDNGYDFVIKKDQQGDYASYTLSNFARRPSSLGPDLEGVAQEGMIDLATARPKQYEMARIEAMLEAAISGAPYDDAEWREGGNGGNSEGGSAGGFQLPSADTPAAPQTPAAESAPAPSPAPESSSAGGDEDDAQARARKAIEQLKARRSGE